MGKEKNWGRGISPTFRETMDKVYRLTTPTARPGGLGPMSKCQGGGKKGWARVKRGRIAKRRQFTTQ